jgi:hypothetical protein
LSIAILLLKIAPIEAQSPEPFFANRFFVTARVTKQKNGEGLQRIAGTEAGFYTENDAPSIIFSYERIKKQSAIFYN